MTCRIVPLYFAAWLCALTVAIPALCPADPPAAAPTPTFSQLKAAGATKSRYRNRSTREIGAEAPKPQLETFRKQIQPLLKAACHDCHGADTQEGNVRIDTLNPDLLHGEDVSWWLEILAVLTKGEMPPPDSGDLSDSDRARIIQWLSSEVQVASIVRRAEQGHSSFRRLTRYEFNYALQDLIGLPYNFAKELPPESNSEDGFQNSSELLGLSSSQLALYRKLSRNALRRATVRGERPAPIYWSIPMRDAAKDFWETHDATLSKIEKAHQGNPVKLQEEVAKLQTKHRVSPKSVHYRNLTTGAATSVKWNYRKAQFARKPWDPPNAERQASGPVPPEVSDYVAVIPPRQKLLVELGDRIPEEGLLRVRVRAARMSNEGPPPSLQLEFGWQASNDSQATVRISDHDLVIQADASEPEFYQWEIPTSEIYPRNSVRHINRLGDLPNPSEYIRLVNSSLSGGDIQVDYVEVAAPVYRQWPPESHLRIFPESNGQASEAKYAREILARFMPRAWRRPVSVVEIDQKLRLLNAIRDNTEDFQEAMIEVLATVLASPQFLYLVRHESSGDALAKTADPLSQFQLAARLATFLWCSIPDDELFTLAAQGELSNDEVLINQVDRMLADPRSHRFSKHFTRQWLGLELLDYLRVDRKAYPHASPNLMDALRKEPIAFFHEVLGNNHSVLDFLHADYTMANERLARHYGVGNVFGNHWRRIKFRPELQRGGLLTQAGLLAMNSDGKDSHPLKRGIWLLESLLNDPPPPPPPAVPEIDLADPEIAKLTLKERIENHRNHAACMSCHAKIDPWGIAFENFDAIGSWRSDAAGKPVDASSRLFNGQELAGMDGLKRFLLQHRQDQFVRALVHKTATYALGRPLTFSDRAAIEQITGDLRKRGDGLATLIKLIVTSDLFQSQ